LSIRAPEIGGYQWHQVEISSPAYYFTPGSLKEVRLVCDTLLRAYRINCNRSTGFHVHVGNAQKEFNHKVIQNLMATIFNFEDQFRYVYFASNFMTS
jgi:Putative amidoligase enzyme